MKRESTAFAVLIVKNAPETIEGPIWAKFYWSANSGMYGHQVITECNLGDGFSTFKTGGCGYCKKSQALETFVSKVIGEYRSFGGDLHYYLGNGESGHYSGGNYFEIDYKDLGKIDKLNR